jgi:hypothetical protein
VSLKASKLKKKKRPQYLLLFVYVGLMPLFQLTSIYSYTMLMILVVSSILIGATDPDYHMDGYFWTCVHILTTGKNDTHNILLLR